MSEEQKRQLSDLDGRPYGDIYRLLRKKVRAAEGAGRAGENPPERWDRPELVRFFKRLGTIPQSWSAQRAALRVCLAASEMASEYGCGAGAVYRDLLGFCSDESGSSTCRETPLCSECRLRPYCTYAAKRPSIKDLPESERPRERLLSIGEEHLSDSELLAIIIRAGTRQESALELARRLLSRFGTFRRLADCSVAELSSVKGIGQAKVAQIKAALGIAKRFAGEQIQAGMQVKGSQQLFDHFHERLRGLKRETFFALLLDTKHRVIVEEKVAVGSLNESVVHPREVFRRAVAESAGAVVFVHNHPSGNPEPSPQDRLLTRRLCDVGRLMGIRVLDHLIIGNERYFSFAEQGLIGSEGDA